MKPLKLPITVQTPELSELPNKSEYAERIERRKSANIVEGFTFQNDQDNEYGYKFYSEINVDTDRFWSLFKALVVPMPEDVALLYNQIDCQVKYGRYLNKYEVLNFIEPYAFELTNDAFIEFGLIHSSNGQLQEVFVDRCKYLKYWGINEESFYKIMSNFEIYKIDDLEFIDSYPVMRTILTEFKEDILETDELIQIFENKFGDEQII